MKRLLLPLLAALALPTAVEANWFGYGSSREAYSACRDWVRKNKKQFRICKRDPETRQVLGYIYFKVKKRFKY